MEVTLGTDNIIENFNVTTPAVTFTNDGEILVTGTGTKLTLISDTLNDFTATHGGTI